MDGIWCVGAGAVGGTMAARLTRAGLRPVVVDTDPEQVAQLRSPGMIVTSTGVSSPAGEDAPVPIDAITPDEISRRDDPCRLVLLAVRTDATERALQPLTERLDGDVVSVQNGLNEDRIARMIGPDRTIGCVVGFGVTWLAPGRVELTSQGGLAIGRLDGSRDDRLATAAEILGTAFDTDIVEDIRAALWAKLLVNSVTVLGAVGGVLTGEVLAPEHHPVVCQVIAEGVDIAVRSGVALPNVLGVDTSLIADRSESWQDVLSGVLDAVAPLFADVKSVTLRDFERGHPIEIDAVTGELVKRAADLGVEAPLNTLVYDVLTEIAGGSRRPEPSNFELLHAAMS